MSAPPSGSSAAEPRFGAVVPLKVVALAKSRLAELGDDVRRDLVRAFVADTVTAVLDCPLVGRVLVVTDDVAVALDLRDLGVAAIPDGRTDDLNASLCEGAAELVRRHPGLRPVAVCADLPALRPTALAAALGAAPGDRPFFVPDAAGVGTTVYAAADLASFAPRFGAGSAAAHRAGGAAEVAADASLRRDVDTAEDLAAAVALGVGPRTAFVVTRFGLAGPTTGA